MYTERFDWFRSFSDSSSPSVLHRFLRSIHQKTTFLPHYGFAQEYDFYSHKTKFYVWSKFSWKTRKCSDNILWNSKNLTQFNLTHLTRGCLYTSLIEELTLMEVEYWIGKSQQSGILAMYTWAHRNVKLCVFFEIGLSCHIVVDINDICKSFLTTMSYKNVVSNFCNNLINC